MGMAEPIDPNKDTSGPPQPTLLDVIRAELAALAAVSKDYRKKIEEAKTNVKRDLYTKKLKKNNKRVMEMLVAADKLIKAKGTGESTANVPPNETAE